MIGKFKQVLDNLIQLSNHPIIQSSPLAVAVSGGSDSMALTLLAHQAGLDIVALTVDHQLRPESCGEAEQVAAWIDKRGIPHHILCWEHAKITGNLQAAARQARYRLLTDYCKAQGIETLLLGHTEDDQAETIALRQERDAGPVGLAGMSAVTEKNGVMLLRPLLSCRRQQLREYLQQQNQGWLDDPSNENADFARIRIRNALREDPERHHALIASGEEMAGRRRRIEKDYQQFVESAVSAINGHSVQIQQKAWRQLAAEIALYALAQMLLAVSGRPYPPRYRELQSLHQRIQEAPGKATLGKCVIIWDAQVITLAPEGIESRGCGLAKPLVRLPFYSIQGLS